MKSRCRQSLLFVAFLLLSLNTVNAAEAELKSQNQLDQDTWVATYEIVSDYELELRPDRSSDDIVPEELKELVDYLNSFDGVKSLKISHSNKTIEITSTTEIDFPNLLNK